MARKNREKQSLKSKLLTEMLVDEPKIEMLSNREIIIDGCKGVVEYTENHIKLSLGIGAICISGDNLVIKSFDSSIAVISGTITDISFTS